MKDLLKQMDSIQLAIPAIYTEENLEQLESLVRRYDLWLKNFSTPEYNFEYYTDGIRMIETEMLEAKYGQSESQRESSFASAVTAFREQLDQLRSILVPAEY